MAVLVLFLSFGVLYVAAQKRASQEVLLIFGSPVSLGLWWHVRMWFTGKAPTGIIAVLLFALCFPGIYPKLIASACMGFTAMVWYSLWFDQFLSLERGLSRWYISQAKTTALTDKVLYYIKVQFNLTDKQTHLIVKLPLLFIGLITCLSL
jgi:hypothetical protein